MYQLLKLVPTATLIDMYISDNIKSIFKNVKEEYLERTQYIQGKKQKKPSEPETITPASTTQVVPAKKSEQKPQKSKKWIWWTAGGAVVAIIVVTFILLSGQEEDPPPKIIL